MTRIFAALLTGKALDVLSGRMLLLERPTEELERGNRVGRLTFQRIW